MHLAPFRALSHTTTEPPHAGSEPAAQPSTDTTRRHCSALVHFEGTILAARALVDWARLLRQTEGKSTDPMRRLIQFPLSIDEAPHRSRLRRAMIAEDEEAILHIAEEQGATLDAATIIFLADELWWSDLHEEAQEPGAVLGDQTGRLRRPQSRSRSPDLIRSVSRKAS
jgi:hypothetical protein